MAVEHAQFSMVLGYKTRANAVKRGEEVAAMHSGLEFRWVVIALPNGRFAPCIIVNNNVHGGPGPFLGLTNVCLIN